MTDETRDALLLAVAEWIVEYDPDAGCAFPTYLQNVVALLARARHEQQYPEDRG